MNVWELAGAIPIDPDPFTLAELADLAAAARRRQYDVAAWLGHIIANAHRSPTTPPYTPAMMHPDTAATARPPRSAAKLTRHNFKAWCYSMTAGH